MVCYFVDQSIMSEDHNKRGFDFVLDILKKYPDTNIKLVHCFDDICLRCVKRRPDTKGSVWGKDSSCTSSDNPEVVKGVHESNDRTLAILGLHYGSVIKWMDLVKLLREKIPVLNDKWIGGLENQERYEKGLRMLLG
jgi:hypothetical protein